jgi:hypothetical protein
LSDNQGEEKRDFGSAMAAIVLLGMGASMLLALPAIYMLCVAIWEAITTGTVRVNPSSRHALRASVPWPQAWAHLLGLALIIAGGLSWLLALAFPKGRMPSFVVASALLAAPLGAVLWLASGNLTTIGGVLFLVGFLVFVAAVFWIDRKFGRLVTTMVLFGFVGLALYLTASHA